MALTTQFCRIIKWILNGSSTYDIVPMGGAGIGNVNVAKQISPTPSYRSNLVKPFTVAAAGTKNINTGWHTILLGTSSTTNLAMNFDIQLTVGTCSLSGEICTTSGTYTNSTSENVTIYSISDNLLSVDVASDGVCFPISITKFDTPVVVPPGTSKSFTISIDTSKFKDALTV